MARLTSNGCDAVHRLPRCCILEVAANVGRSSRGGGIGGGLGMSQDRWMGGGRADCSIGILAAHDDQEGLSSGGPTILMHFSSSRWVQSLANGSVTRWIGKGGKHLRRSSYRECAFTVLHKSNGCFAALKVRSFSLLVRVPKNWA